MNKKLFLVPFFAIAFGVCLFQWRPALARPSTSVSTTAFSPADTGKVWIARSDSYTQMLIDLDQKYYPESGSREGVTGYDTLVSAPTLKNSEVERSEDEALLQKYKNALKTERNPKVARDLQVLIDYITLRFRRQDYELANSVVVYNAADFIFTGLHILLEEQVPDIRRSAAVARILKYVGMGGSGLPLTEIYRTRIQAQMSKAAVTYPNRGKMELDMANSEQIMAGIPELFRKYKLTGWEEAFAKLNEQVKEYNKWLREKVMVKARDAFKLPAEEYKINLVEQGVDIAPADLAKIAHAAFTDIQGQMQPIAAQIAKERNFPSADYRDVIRELKKQQFHGDEIIPVYERNLHAIEDIISKRGLVTLPARPAIIRLSSAAEAAQNPAPHMVAAPFLNNTGQRGSFVLPLSLPSAADGTGGAKYDDFTYPAASWTLIAHEARPGHELQFDRLLDDGISKARVLYADNNVSDEGWALYAEYLMQPYMPLEGQLISLDFRLQRAARAFLDPGLQAGLYTQAQALDILMKDVVFSRGYAQQEVNRYTLDSPGQANSYFYGFTQILALRKDTEAALGDKFNALRFHDFILTQGPLPLSLIREAVINDFVPAEKSRH